MVLLLLPSSSIVGFTCIHMHRVIVPIVAASVVVSAVSFGGVLCCFWTLCAIRAVDVIAFVVGVIVVVVVIVVFVFCFCGVVVTVVFVTIVVVVVVVVVVLWQLWLWLWLLFW